MRAQQQNTAILAALHQSLRQGKEPQLNDLQPQGQALLHE